MTFYEVLGVATNATDEDLRAAYLRQARSAHPDRPGGDAERMARVNEAWSVLSDPRTRRRYDAQVGREGRARAAADGGGDEGPDPVTFTERPEIVDDGEPLSSRMRLLTRLVPLLFVVGVLAATVGLLLQVGPIFGFGVAACVGAGLLFVLMPFFAMSARR